MAQGKFFEEFNVGDKYITGARTMTETDIVMFGALTWDHAPLHTDDEFMKTTQYGQKICHGLLNLSVTSGLYAQMIDLWYGTTIAFLGINNLRFVAATYAGDTVHVELELINKRETSKPDRGILTFKVILKNQKGEPVLECEQLLMMRRKG